MKIVKMEMMVSIQKSYIKKKKSKMDVTKSDKKKVPAVKGKRETDESIMQDH